jgi:hypothetical protein
VFGSYDGQGPARVPRRVGVCVTVHGSHFVCKSTGLLPCSRAVLNRQRKRPGPHVYRRTVRRYQAARAVGRRRRRACSCRARERRRGLHSLRRIQDGIAKLDVRFVFLPLPDGAGRAPYAMPRCDTGYLSNPTIWSLSRSIAACVRRRQRLP